MRGGLDGLLIYIKVQFISRCKDSANLSEKQTVVSFLCAENLLA